MEQNHSPIINADFNTELDGLMEKSDKLIALCEQLNTQSVILHERIQNLSEQSRTYIADFNLIYTTAKEI